MMLNVIAHQSHGIALAFATGSIVSATKIHVRAAERRLDMAASFAPISAKSRIGAGLNTIVGAAGRRDTTRRRLPSLQNLAVSVSVAATMTGGCWRSTTSSQKRNCDPLIACIQRRSASSFGGRKWGTCNCFARTAIASRLGNNPGSDIACDRIRKAYAQPDMFIEQAKAPEPKQEAMPL